jgi:hypothetical protein
MYPELSSAKDAHIGQLVNYGGYGPYLVTKIVDDSIWIKNLEDGCEFEMVKSKD